MPRVSVQFNDEQMAALQHLKNQPKSNRSHKSHLLGSFYPYECKRVHKTPRTTPKIESLIIPD